MRRPVDAQMTQVGETDVDRPVAPVERRVQVNAQAGDGRLIDSIGSAGGKHGQARLRGRRFASQELAFGPVQFERENELRPALPTVVWQQCRTGHEIVKG